MYTIILRDNKSLQATRKEAIVQYSNLVDKIQFLIAPVIGENDMTSFDTVFLEYLSPISKIYRTEFLTRSEDLYKDYLQFILPADTKITAEHGDIELQLTFYKTEMTAKGESQRIVFKTLPCKIKVFPLTNWSNFIPTEALTSLDDKISKLSALQKEITETQEHVMNIIDDDNVSDNTTYSSKKIEERFLDNDEVKEVEKADIDEIFTVSIAEHDINNLF